MHDPFLSLSTQTADVACNLSNHDSIQDLATDALRSSVQVRFQPEMQISLTPSLRSPLPLPLSASHLPPLTSESPLPSCKVCVIIPVRNEGENLPAVIDALAHQVDSAGAPVDFDSYEILVLANNCTDDTVTVLDKLGQLYPALRLHTIEVVLPKSEACIGKARQMIMHEAYRRLDSIGANGRIIASTDGDTEVASNWISTLISEFERGVDAVGGRIITHRSAALDINAKISLYFLRLLGHGYLASQIECLLDPQSHDCWPRHCQYYGANMAVLATVYGCIGGMPLVKDEEDVALYQRLKLFDAKIRHSPDVRVLTSARRDGRATGGLAERLEELAHTSQAHQVVLVETPQITEARIRLRQQLRQIWSALHEVKNFSVRRYEQTALLLAKRLGLTQSCLRQELEQAPTFGLLLESLTVRQRQYMDRQIFSDATIEISRANMYLRARLQVIRQQAECASNQELNDPRLLRQTLQQVQAIPLFFFTRQ